MQIVLNIDLFDQAFSRCAIDSDYIHRYPRAGIDPYLS